MLQDGIPNLVVQHVVSVATPLDINAVNIDVHIVELPDVCDITLMSRPGEQVQYLASSRRIARSSAALGSPGVVITTSVCCCAVPALLAPV